MGYPNQTDGLGLGTLRKANLKRLPTFRNAKDELAHSKADGSDWTPERWLVAVMGELGELANLYKKYFRGDFGNMEEMFPEFQEEAGKEIADVIIYLDLLAKQWDIDLSKAVREKFNEVSERVDSPVYIGNDNDCHLR